MDAETLLRQVHDNDCSGYLFSGLLRDAVRAYFGVSAELLAARELAADVSSRITGKVRLKRGDESGVFDDGLAASTAILTGLWDDSDIVQDMLVAIERGRELAAAGQRVTPERLTIKVDGPQGSGKTRIGQFLSHQLPLHFATMTRRGQVFDPQIVEMRDGRPFDVRNDEFLD